MPKLSELATTSGSLTSTATTANQVIVSYTVPANRTFVFTGFQVQCRSTSPPGNANPVVFGTASLEVPATTKQITFDFVGNVAPNEHGGPFGEPWLIPGGNVVRVVCTPAAATSFLWRANLWGYLA